MSDANRPSKPPTVTGGEAKKSNQRITAVDAWGAADSRSLRQVRLGLTLVYFGTCIMILGIVLTVAYLIQGTAYGMASIMFFAAVWALMALVGYLLQMIGPFLCLAAPDEMGSKGLILGSMACLLISSVRTVSAWIGVELTSFDQLISAGIHIIGVILFILFLWSLSLSIGRRDLAHQAVTVLGFAIAFGLVFLGVALFTLGPLLGESGGKKSEPGWHTWALAAAALCVLIMYANLLNAVRQALRSKKPSGR